MHILYKEKFETCLACLNRHGLEGYTYAGRLDPLASGVLIALPGGDIAGKARIQQLPKTYEFEVVLGVVTDTFDELGIIVSDDTYLNWPTLRLHKEEHLSGRVIEGIRAGYQSIYKFSADGFRDSIASLQNIPLTQSYPFFSSKPVSGMPLFEYTKKYGIEETIPKLPTIEVSINNIDFLSREIVSVESVSIEAGNICDLVKGDFRQDFIKKSWQMFSSNRSGEMEILKFRATVSSGFYIRTFAFWLGQVLGKGAIVRNLVRISVGEYRIVE